MVGFDDPGLIRWDAGAAQAIEESRPSGFGGPQSKWTADKADLTMAQNGQMLHSLIDTGSIIYRQHAAKRSRWSRIDEHYRNVIGGEAVEKKVLKAECHDGDSVHFALQHAPGTYLHL